jgi:hypothetical protein
MVWSRHLKCPALLAAALAVCLVGCAHRQSDEGTGGLLGLSSPGALSAGSVGYVDMQAIIAVHPLHSQLDSMQGQIGVLQQESVIVPTGMNEQQTGAYNQMQRELASAADKFQQDLAQRRAYYERREADAIAQLQAAALGTSPAAGGVLGGLQQQYGDQAKALQKNAFDTLNKYRDELFRQDAEHLKHVQELIAAEMRAKLRQRESDLSSAETKYQIQLVRADQEERLNLQAKLQNLALSDKDRAAYQAQLQAIDTRQQGKINVVKARDAAQLTALENQLRAQAAAKYETERKASQTATQAKLVARQREMQTAMTPQMQALSGKFQAQLNDVNSRLSQNQKYRTQAESVHNQMQAGYVAEATKAEASYNLVRSALITKYSAIAHMQFQDNDAIAAQAQKLAADRRDLYQKIADQVQTQVQQIAQKDGIAVVFDSVRGAGSAIDLTDQVEKAINSMPGAGSATPTTSGGS